MKKPFSPVMKDGEDVVILRFQPYIFNGNDLVKRKIRSLLQRKPNAQREMSEQVYLFLKEWFSGEGKMNSHLFEGLNIFCIYNASSKTYIALNNTRSIEERTVPFSMRTSHFSKVMFWLLESVERKPYAMVAGTHHEISIMCGMYFKQTA